MAGRGCWAAVPAVPRLPRQLLLRGAGPAAELLWGQTLGLLEGARGPRLCPWRGGSAPRAVRSQPQGAAGCLNAGVARPGPA